jgi:hypothetical protein
MGPLSKMTVQKWGQTFNFDREHERGGDDDDDDDDDDEMTMMMMTMMMITPSILDYRIFGPPQLSETWYQLLILRG